MSNLKFKPRTEYTYVLNLVTENEEVQNGILGKEILPLPLSQELNKVSWALSSSSTKCSLVIDGSGVLSMLVK